MNLDKLKKYDTKYQKYIKENYAANIPDDTDSSENYSKVGRFYFILEAPYHYEVEDEMLEYARKHPKADIAELYQYFTFLVPSGTLPPDADEWDDDEDDE